MVYFGDFPGDNSLPPPRFGADLLTEIPIIAQFLRYAGASNPPKEAHLYSTQTLAERFTLYTDAFHRLRQGGFKRDHCLIRLADQLE